MGCVSSHEEHDPVYNNMTENNINRFKVTTDESLASEVSIVVRATHKTVPESGLMIQSVKYNNESMRSVQ